MGNEWRKTQPKLSFAQKTPQGKGELMRTSVRTPGGTKTTRLETCALNVQGVSTLRGKRGKKKKSERRKSYARDRSSKKRNVLKGRGAVTHERKGAL